MRVVAIGLGCALLLAVMIRAAPTAIESRYNRVRNLPPYIVSSEVRNLHERILVADLHADSLLWDEIF